jgi:succinoglycan biosynthesis transport protein ExoP
MIATKPHAAAPGGADEEINLREIWHTLVRNRWMVLGIAFVTVVLAALLTWVQRPVYESSATLRIDQDDPRQAMLSMAPLPGMNRQGKLETEMAVLRSRLIAEGVADSLSLAVQLVEPETARDSVLRVVFVPRNAGAATYTLERQENGAYALTAKPFRKGTRLGRLPAQVRAGGSFTVAGAQLQLLPQPNAKDAPSTIKFVVLPFRQTVEGLLQSMVVVRPDRDANIVAIGFRSVDPVIAAAVPNAVTTHFIEYKTRLSKSEGGNKADFLRDQVSTYQLQLAAAEDRLRDFRETQRVVSPVDEATEQVKRLAELQAQRDELRGNRDALAQLLARAQAGSAGNRTSHYRDLAAYPVFLSNRAMQDLLQSLTQLENQRSTLLVQRTPESIDVQGIDARIRQIELQLYELARNYLSSLESQIASADATLGRFGGQMALIPAREVEFARLLRQQKLTEEIYSLLQTRLKEVEIQQSVEPGDVRQVDSALIPYRPVSPRPLRNLVLGGMVGLVLGAAAAFARRALDTRVRSRDDVQHATGQMPILGTIPRIVLDRGVVPWGGRRRLPLDGAPTLVVRSEPHGPAAEAFRALRTSIVFSGIHGAPRTLVVTSAMPGEGKSTSSANLALTLAQQGTHALLVDADLRRGTVHRLFGIPQEPGLTHVLLGHVELDAAITGVPLEDGKTLYVLPSGVLPPNPAEILGSERMNRLMAELRERFGAVIFDAPPLNLVTDAAILATKADGTLLIARNGVTDKRALQHATHQLHQVHASVSGVVLNDIDADQGRYYGYSHQSYSAFGVNGNGNGNGTRAGTRTG